MKFFIHIPIIMKEFYLTVVLLSEFYRYMPNIYLFLHYG